MRRRPLLSLVLGLVLSPAALVVAQDRSGEPVEDYQRAAALFRAGQRDEAAYWFYRGQLRARIYLSAHPDLPPDGAPALYASLNEVVGRPINEWAFGDIPSLARTIDRVLADHAAADDPATPKRLYPAAHAQVTAGLASLRTRILTDQQSIAAQRTANGLANRVR